MKSKETYEAGSDPAIPSPDAPQRASVNSCNWSRLIHDHAFRIVILIALLILLPYSTRRITVGLCGSGRMRTSVTAEETATAVQKLRREIQVLDRKLTLKTPSSPYLVINSAMNVFRLYNGQVLVKEDKCSTGSYILLKDGDRQQWLFETPKGEFRVRGKITSPVWRKPDWAFVEEGLPVPPVNHFSRYEYGVLGDYALSLGNGYLIHGTLYQRLLGMPVTHGCIRLNDENLELVYRSLNTGSKVYIF